MGGEKLRRILEGEENREDRLGNLESGLLSEVLSYVLINFEFDSWQYAVISEACSRLLPDEEYE